MTSIRRKQIGKKHLEVVSFRISNITYSKSFADALKQMLNLNEPISSSSGETVWKVLVYDRFGQDIISPLISIKELRELGVTLHV